MNKIQKIQDEILEEKKEVAAHASKKAKQIHESLEKELEELQTEVRKMPIKSKVICGTLIVGGAFIAGSAFAMRAKRRQKKRDEAFEDLQ